MEKKEVTIDGIVCIPKKNELKIKDSNGNSMYMVRTYSAGVFYGYLYSIEGKTVILHNARRVWRWVGAATLSQLAQSGTTKPKQCKFPQHVSEIILTEAIELIPVTEEALKTLEEVEIWKI